MKSSWKIPERLYIDNRTWHRLWASHSGCVKGPQSLPPTTTEIRKQLAAAKKIHLIIFVIINATYRCGTAFTIS